MLGSKSQGSLLSGGGLIEWGPALMGHTGHVKPGSWLDGPIKAHGTRTLKPHLVWRPFEAHGPLLLEAHWSRSRTRSHVTKALHRPLKVARSRPLHLKPRWRLLSDGTLKPPRALRVRRTIKLPHTVSTSQWTMRHVASRCIKPLWHVVMRWPAAIKPARTLVVRPVKLG